MELLEEMRTPTRVQWALSVSNLVIMVGWSTLVPEVRHRVPGDSEIDFRWALPFTHFHVIKYHKYFKRLRAPSVVNKAHWVSSCSPCFAWKLLSSEVITGESQVDVSCSTVLPKAVSSMNASPLHEWVVQWLTDSKVMLCLITVIVARIGPLIKVQMGGVKQLPWPAPKRGSAGVEW